MTCEATYPQIIDSEHRIISLVWHVNNSSLISKFYSQEVSQLDVQMSAYMRFEGSFSIADSKFLSGIIYCFI